MTPSAVACRRSLLGRQHRGPAHRTGAAQTLRGLALLGMLGGCATGGDAIAAPQQTALAFSRALSRGDVDTAYALMTPDYRQRTSRDAFAAALSDNHDETMALAEAIARHRSQAQVVAEIPVPDAAAVRLTLQDGQWRVDPAALSFYDQSTPRAALQAFVTALARRRYDVLIRLIPEADKEGITQQRLEAAFTGPGREDMERLLSNLESHLDAPIEVVGDHAIMPYGDHLRMQFVREDGAWKVADPE